MEPTFFAKTDRFRTKLYNNGIEELFLNLKTKTKS